MRRLMAVSAISAVLSLFINVPDTISESYASSDFESKEQPMIWDGDHISTAAIRPWLASLNVEALASEYADRHVEMANERRLASEFTEPYKDLRAARLLASEYSDNVLTLRAQRIWVSEFDTKTDHKSAARALASEFADRPDYTPSARVLASEFSVSMTRNYSIRLAGRERISQTSALYHAR